MKRILWIFIGLMLVLCGPVFAITIDSQWQSLETAHFRIYYQKPQLNRVLQFASRLELAVDRVTALTVPIQEKIPVVFEDYGMMANGFAEEFSRKIFVGSRSPMSTGIELASVRNWYEFVGTHELMHIQHLQGTTDPTYLRFKSLFGNWIAPNVYSPLWLAEGLAVYAESSPERGWRLQDGYYKEIAMQQAAENKMGNIFCGTYSFFQYPYYSLPYAYGAQFIQYLAEQYGAEKVQKFIEKQGNNFWALPGMFLPMIGLDASAKSVFGVDFYTLYSEWQRDTVKAAQTYQNTDLTLTHGRGYRRFLTEWNNQILYIHKSVNKVAPLAINFNSFLMRLDPETGKETALLPIDGEVTLPLQRAGNDVYFGVLDVRFGYQNVTFSGYGFHNVIYRYSLKTGSVEPVMAGNIRAFCVTPERDLIYVEDNQDTHGSIILRHRPGRTPESLGRTDFLVSEIQPYQRDFIVVAKPEVGSWGIYRFNLMKLSLRPIINTSGYETKLSVVGDWIYFNTTEKNQSQLYRYHLVNKQFQQVSARHFAAFGVPVRDRVYYMGLNSEGEQVCSTPLNQAQQKPTPSLEIMPTASEIPLDYREANPYSHLGALMNPYSRLMPRLNSLGLAIGEDDLGVHRYALSYTYLGEFRASYYTTAIQPMTLGYTYGSITGHQIWGDYSVYRSLQSGIKSVNLGFEAMFSGGFVPYVSSSWGSTDFLSSGTVALDSAHGGHALSSAVTYYLNDASVQLSARMFTRFESIYALRGYGWRYDEASGFECFAGFTHRICALNSGFWNPQIAYGDLFGQVFVAHNSTMAPYWTYGYEFQLEGATGYSIRFVPRSGFAYSYAGLATYLAVDINL